jgi:hypothetical protein
MANQSGECKQAQVPALGSDRSHRALQHAMDCFSVALMSIVIVSVLSPGAKVSVGGDGRVRL